MKFTQSHEWVELRGSIGVVGISNYAQKELGDIVYIELPKVGSQIKAGDQVAVLESTKAAADVYSPVSGEVIAVNERLHEFPEKVNQDAQNEQDEGGWLYKIKLSDLREYEKLMDNAAYVKYVSS